MGGYRSGRWGDHEKKCTVEECLAVDLLILERNGVFAAQGEDVRGELTWLNKETGNERAAINFSLEHWDGEPVLRLEYRVPGAGMDMCIPVRIQVNRNRCGAVRHYGICPKCNRRITKLYVPPGEDEFLCRICHKLTYVSSQRAHELGGMTKRAAELMRRNWGG